MARLSNWTVFIWYLPYVTDCRFFFFLLMNPDMVACRIVSSHGSGERKAEEERRDQALYNACFDFILSKVPEKI